MRIAIDAMGGDNAPDEIISGALESVEVLDSDDELIAGYLTDLLTALKRAGKDRAARVIEDRLSGIDTPPPDWATVGGVLPADKR